MQRAFRMDSALVLAGACLLSAAAPMPADAIGYFHCSFAMQGPAELRDAPAGKLIELLHPGSRLRSRHSTGGLLPFDDTGKWIEVGDGNGGMLGWVARDQAECRFSGGF